MLDNRGALVYMHDALDQGQSVPKTLDVSGTILGNMKILPDLGGNIPGLADWTWQACAHGRPEMFLASHAGIDSQPARLNCQAHICLFEFCASRRGRLFAWRLIAFTHHYLLPYFR